MRLRSIALVLSLGMLSAVHAHACSCAYGDKTCVSAKPHGTQFLGEVIGTRSVSIPAHFPGRDDLFTRALAFRIRVKEVFSGSQKVGDEVEVRTGTGGGDCGYPFVVGERYLVDAYEIEPTAEVAALNGVHLGAGICGMTAPENRAAVELAQLRTEIAKQRQPDLMGSVIAVDGLGEEHPQLLAGISVTLQAESDGMTYHAQTGDDGVYRVASLPPGKYTAQFLLPSHRTVLNLQTPDKSPTIQIPHTDGTGAACSLSVLAAPSGVITGRLVDAAGKGHEGFVAAYPLGTAEHSGQWSAAGETAPDGVFALHFLPDGAYDLEFSSDHGKRPQISHAEVHDGAVTSDVTLHLP